MAEKYVIHVSPKNECGYHDIVVRCGALDVCQFYDILSGIDLEKTPTLTPAQAASMMVEGPWHKTVSGLFLEMERQNILAGLYEMD